ncbi:MAG: response regulator [Pseudomonadota bacterium]
MGNRASPAAWCRLSENRYKSVRILLVEDDPINSIFSTSLLKGMGFIVDDVSNGEEAIRLLESVPYDAVLMDVQMPVMDGFEATRIIRNRESKVLNHHIPIIALTAHDMKEDHERCLENGMDDYVIKPIEPQKLMGAIGRQLANAPSLSIKAEEKEAAPCHEGPVRSDPSRPFYGDDGLFRRLVNIFLESLPNQIRELKQALKSEEAYLVETLGHTIKGGSDLIQACSLRDCASEIEKAGKSHDLKFARELVDRLEDEYKRFSSQDLLTRDGEGPGHHPVTLPGTPRAVFR